LDVATEVRRSPTRRTERARCVVPASAAGSARVARRWSRRLRRGDRLARYRQDRSRREGYPARRAAH